MTLRADNPSVSLTAVQLPFTGEPLGALHFGKHGIKLEVIYFYLEKEGVSAVANTAFSRTESMLGREAMEKLSRSHIAVFGLGGVGSWAAESLCRAGVGTLTLIDSDTISETNLNRQLYALRSTVGLPKAEVAAARCRDINEAVTVYPIVGTYDAAHREDFFGAQYDYIVDCIDLVSCKLDLIEQAQARGIPILTALGTGNKRDASQFTVTDISKTYGCPLARIMRKELRQRDIHHLKVVFSPEEPQETVQTEAPPPGRRSVPSSVSWVPASAGLLMAQTVVEDLIAKGGEGK